jgi:hypothetical protein
VLQFGSKIYPIGWRVGEATEKTFLEHAYQEDEEKVDQVGIVVEVYQQCNQHLT